jgi:uncharacterized membrane protein YcaP (DUF421 family)
MLDLIDYNYLRIIGTTTAVYLFIVIAIRLFGKRELAQLSVIDLVFILLISNAVQNAMVGPDSSLTGGLVAATTLFVINYLLKYLQYRFPKFGKIVQGDAIMLIYEGELIPEHLKRVRMTEEELMEAIREHGVSKIREVDLAVLEVDGNISVLSNQYKKKTMKRRKGHKLISKQQY